MANVLVTSDASSFFGGMAGKARNALKGRKEKIEEELEKATGKDSKKEEKKEK
jgi:hypothetical protein